MVGVSRRDLPGLVRVNDYGDAPEGDVLVHLAEGNDRARVEQAGEGYARGIRETLQRLLGKKYSRIVYASSAALYGDKSPRPRRPEDAVHSSDTYARLKHDAECAVLERHGGVVRLANVYGPGMPATNVLSRVLAQIPGRGPLHVRDTAPVRDFLWVDDAGEGLLRLACVPEGIGVFNLGTGTGTSIGDLARLCLDLAGEGMRDVVSQSSARTTSILILDSSSTTRVCGWQARTMLRDGLANLLRAPISS